MDQARVMSVVAIVVALGSGAISATEDLTQPQLKEAMLACGEDPYRFVVETTSEADGLRLFVLTNTYGTKKCNIRVYFDVYRGNKLYGHGEALLKPSVPERVWIDKISEKPRILLKNAYFE